MSFKQLLIVQALAASLVFGSAVNAQGTRGAGLDFTLGRHSLRGGIVRERSGVLFDALATGRLRASSRWEFVAGGGASAAIVGAALGASSDDCLLLANGQCARQGNFAGVNALAGVAYGVGSGTIRALVGPALYRGADDSSLGFQGRIDASVPLASRAGGGVMLRATRLPSHGGQRFTLWAFGVSLTYRTHGADPR